MKLPEHLEQAPLVEAVFELRFSSSEVFAGDVLPGLLYGELREDFGEVEPLPAASLPRDVRTKDQRLRYQPHVRLVGSAETVLVGDHVLSFSKTPPYTGWPSFRGRVDRILQVVRATEIVNSAERFSLKCVNFLGIAESEQLGALKLAVSASDLQHTERGFRLRMEFEKKETVSILEIVTGASAVLDGEQVSGLLLSVDTIQTTEPDSLFSSIIDRLDSSHQILKEIFFAMLTTETLESLGPKWSEE